MQQMNGHTGKISLARVQSLKELLSDRHLEEKQGKPEGTFCQCYLQLLAFSCSGIS